MASVAFVKGSAEFAAGTTVWGTSDIRVMLVAAGIGTPNKDTVVFLDDIDANRYGGLTQADDVAATSDAVNIVAGYTECDHGVVQFPSVAFNTGNAVGAVWYRWTGDRTTSPVLAYDEFTAPVTPDGNNINYTPVSTGVLRFAH